MKRLYSIVILFFLLACSHDKQTVDVTEEDAVSSADIIIPNLPANKKEDGIDEENTDTLDRVIGFEGYTTDVYNGDLQAPDFEGNPFAGDKEYVSFIRKGCENNGINFGGHYTIIERGCGMNCLHFFIVDRKTGKIFVGTRPNDGRYGYHYRKDSKLFIANASLFIDDTFTKYEKNRGCSPEFYQWTGKKFVML